MKKLQQFHIFKFCSKRLKRKNYRIKELTLQEARCNQEVINISDSELVRVLFKVEGKEFSQIEVDNIVSQKKIISKKKNSPENKQKIKDLNERLDNILFLPQIISIQFEDRRHFQNIVDRGGVEICGRNYVFFMASSGQTRRDQSYFIDSTIKEQVEKILNNGRNLDKPLVPQKFMAYYGLYSSSSQEITFPRLCVVKDVLITTTKKVDFSTFISEDEEPIIKEEEKTLEYVGADGQGLMLPSFAKQIARDLELDYVPSAVICRAPFCKGLLCTFDFVDFAEKIAKTNTIIDIYGNAVNINNVDVIISESQFKLWDSYSNTQEYVNNCKKNNLGFGVSRVSPAIDKSVARSSYQFLQILKLSDRDIENLCESTLTWLNNVSGNDLESSLLFLLGEIDTSEKDWFGQLDAPLQALIMDGSLINDSFFKKYFAKNVTKKKEDAKLGKLIFHGNYSFAVADPFGQTSAIFGLSITPLLRDGEHYCKFWLERNIKRVMGVRSPIVHASELNPINIQDREDTNYWFRYLDKSVIVFPLNGIGLDFCKLGGADVDGDTVATINHSSFFRGMSENSLPIMYESKKANKIVINNSDGTLESSQIKQIRSNRIGFFTNLASTFTTMLYDFQEDSREYQVLLNRLKYFRNLQGDLIDSAKGITINPFFEWWTKYTKITDDMSEDEKERVAFNNKLISDKRPYFFIHLYKSYKKRYLREISNYNIVSMTLWGIPFEELKVMQNKSPEQEDLVKLYKKQSYFIDNDSAMNRICHYIEKHLREDQKYRRELKTEFDHSVLYSKNFEKPCKRDIDKMLILYKEWKALRKSIMENRYFLPGIMTGIVEETYMNMNQVNNRINNRSYSTINSNSSQLGDLAVYLCYEFLGQNSRNFCWSVFGKEIVANLRAKRKERFVRIPLSTKGGKIKYLFNDYSMHLINIEEQP